MCTDKKKTQNKMNKKIFLSLFASTLLFLSANKLFAGNPDTYIETSTGKHIVCSGVNITLTGHSLFNSNNIAEHSWESSTPGIIAVTRDQFAIVNTRETGIHTINYSVSDYDGNTASAQISIRVFELPDNGVMANKKDHENNKEILLPAELTARDGSSENKYQWFRNNTVIDGATSSHYKAFEPGSYRLMITSAEGCNSYSSAIIIR